MGTQGNVTIAIGASRVSKEWKTKTLPWSEFAKHLSKTNRSIETISEFRVMPKKDRDDLKDVGGFVGGALSGKQRLTTNVARRSVITLDADAVPYKATQTVIDAAESLDVPCVIYSTRNHTPENPRLRICIPLEGGCSPDEYEPIARMVSSWIWKDMSIFDRTTYDVARMMYYPSTCSDGEFVYKSLNEDKPFLAREDALSQYESWSDYRTWPRVPNEDNILRAKAEKRKDPRTSPGIIGAFCKLYDIDTVIQEFLPDTYVSAGDSRYTYTGATTSAGAVLYNDGMFLYSNHASDPACGELCNSFDLVRIHKFSDLDAETDPGTPTVTKPSMKAMLEFASEIPEVRTLRLKDVFSEETLSYHKDTKDVEGDWMEQITINKRSGEPEPTIKNIRTILENDPGLKGHVRFDVMAGAYSVFGKLPWEDTFESVREWKDFDDSCLIGYLETVYHIYHVAKTNCALDEVFMRNKVNPITDWLDTLEWDGKERLDTLMIDYFGAEDNVYTRLAMRKTLTAAVARAYKPGTKFDQMFIIYGPQGIGKTTFFDKLGSAAGPYFAEDLRTFKGKEATEHIQGKWILEIGELAAMNKAESEEVKVFLSNRVDTYRASYAKRTESHPRRCIFVGTTNVGEFLRDSTGSRRFWTIEASRNTKYKKDIFTEFTKEEVEQVWAEALYRYRSGEKLYFEKGSEEHELAVISQQTHREASPKEGIIAEFLAREVPSNWYEMSTQSRELFLNGDMSAKEGTEFTLRDTICPIEIWCECFGNKKGNIKRQDSMELTKVLSNIPGWEPGGRRNVGAGYGRQRVYVRTEEQTDETDD